MRRLLFVVTISVISSLCTIIGYHKMVMPYSSHQQHSTKHASYISPTQNRNLVRLATFDQQMQPSTTSTSPTTSATFDFVNISKIATPAVVHIKTFKDFNSELDIPEDNGLYEIFSDDEDVWNEEEGISYDGIDKLSSGSGVIIRSDGYIVTNNHVIANAKKINVTLHDGEQYHAEVIGRDKTTDIALIKIASKDNKLPTLSFGNSDRLQVGEWVLAVGNPFELLSTVTAGIVSAKRRDIQINPEENAIEAFIQTDAVVNDGNSGGALISVNGELVGITTAIATSNGVYNGYSFAMPSNIVSKVVADLIDHGAVQRAFLGIIVMPPDLETWKRKRLDELKGVYIKKVLPDGAAIKAKLMVGDIITEVNGNVINSESQLNERLAVFRPDESIALTVWRNGAYKFLSVTLTNEVGDYNVLKNSDIQIATKLGTYLEELTPTELRNLGLLNGIRVLDLYDGVIKNNTAIKQGFIIERINDYKVNTIDQLYQQIRSLKKGKTIILEGLYLGKNKKHLSVSYAFKKSW